MAKNSFVAAMDNLPLIVKILLALPFLDGIVYGIYRILKGHVIAGIIWIIMGIWLFWVIDIICIILYKRPTLFA